MAAAVSYTEGAMPDPPENPDTPAPTPDEADTLSNGDLQPTHAFEPVTFSRIGTKIGAFTLKRIIGSGGMGTVYEAMQEQPRRRVAVKMIKRGITSKSALRRFEFESQLLGRLQHPGIAQVYEAGTHDDGSGGVPYFAMEYIANAKSLTQYAQEKKLGTRERLALFAKVCDAVQHGHLKGIVHRDLKPENILIGQFGEICLIDWGVAKIWGMPNEERNPEQKDRGEQLTATGQRPGTPLYMSPEQIVGSYYVDQRTDVYSAGVVLYEILCLDVPFMGKNIHGTFDMVIHDQPLLPSQKNPRRKIPSPLEVICMKALEKDPAKRQPSISELIAQIQEFQQHQKLIS